MNAFYGLNHNRSLPIPLCIQYTIYFYFYTFLLFPFRSGIWFHHDYRPTVQPRIHHISSGGHLQVKKGTTVRIECSASGKFFSFLSLFHYISNSSLLYSGICYLLLYLILLHGLYMQISQIIFFPHGEYPIRCYIFISIFLWRNQHEFAHKTWEQMINYDANNVWILFQFLGNPSPNITWTKKFENLPNGKTIMIYISVSFVVFFRSNFLL